MTNKIRVAVAGACGRMGQEVIKAVLNDPALELVAAIDINNAGKDIGEILINRVAGINIETLFKDAIVNSKADVIVDFTDPESVFNHSVEALECGVRPVIGTTGLTEDQVNKIEKLSKEKDIAALIAPNFTTGAVLMMMFAKTAAKYFDNTEIIELHHNKKKDAPSGTAIKTAQLMSENGKKYSQDNIPEIEAYAGTRGGVTESNIHIHSVRLPGFMASQEVLFGAMGQVLTIRHDSFDRSCYMPGVIMAVKHVMANNNFVYGLENIL